MPSLSRGADNWTQRHKVKTSEPAAAPALIVPVLAAGILMAMLMGTRSSMGLFIGPINTSTALGAATISLAFALSQLAWGAAQPVAGLLAGRLGTTRVIVAGGTLSAIGLALITVASSGPALMATLMLAGAAGAAAGGAPLLMGAVAQRVSAAKRGQAMGLVSAGSSAGQLLLAPLAALLIGSIGWQGALLVFAVLVVAVLPISRVFRHPPAATEVANQSAPAIDARAALREPSFWFISAGFFVCGFHISFLTTHMPGVLELCGFSSSFSGLWLGIVGLCNIAGSLAAGWLMQRVPMKALLGTLYALRAAGVALFLLLPPSREVMLGFALWMGITYMATLPPTSGIIAKLYGARNVAVLFGVTMALHQVGSFLGVWLGGLELELTGGYHWVWMLDILLASAAALAHLPIREGDAGTSASPLRPALAASGTR
jgi:predicted MFS family arabinose efflux permease